jgi:hypothetical protein
MARVDVELVHARPRLALTGDVPALQIELAVVLARVPEALRAAALQPARPGADHADRGGGAPERVVQVGEDEDLEGVKPAAGDGQAVRDGQEARRVRVLEVHERGLEELGAELQLAALDEDRADFLKDSEIMRHALQQGRERVSCLRICQYLTSHANVTRTVFRSPNSFARVARSHIAST